MIVSLLLINIDNFKDVYGKVNNIFIDKCFREFLM